MKLYSIQDKQVNTHGRIFQMHNDTLAKRFYEEMQQEKDSNFQKYPQDYKLVCLGTFNQESGEIVPKKYDVI